MNNKLLNFQSHNDDRGSLIAIESGNNIPIDIKRVYYIYDVVGWKKRGCHAHKNTEEVLICLKGSCTCLLDDGANKEEIILSSPKEGIYVKKRIWVEVYNFSKDCILMVLSQDFYNESDYVRDYENFLKLKEAENEER